MFSRDPHRCPNTRRHARCGQRPSGFPDRKCLRCMRPAPDDARTRCQWDDQFRLEGESPNRPEKPCHRLLFERVFDWNCTLCAPCLSLHGWAWFLCDINGASLSSLFLFSPTSRWQMRCFYGKVIVHMRKKAANKSFNTVCSVSAIFNWAASALLLVEKRTHLL